MDTMKAIRLNSYGGPELLKYEDVAKPQPQENEVLVRIHAASVNPIDWMMESGQYEPLRPQLPFTPGWDFAGTIEGVGSKVNNFRVGDEIYANVGATGGGYADYAIAPVDAIAHKPKTLDFVAAAAVPLVALTAWQALFEVASLSEGQTVLIHGASGGVGSMAVQFAKARGARVIGTASASNADFVRDLGADRVLPLSEARQAQEFGRDGHPPGKIVLKVVA